MRKNIFLFTLGLNFIFFLIFTFTGRFPILLVLLHILTIIILLSSLINFNHIGSFIVKYKKDILIIACLFLIAFAIRVYKVEEITPGMWGDEITIAVAGDRVLSSNEFVPFVDDNYGHATPLLYLGGLTTKLFGKTITAIRFPSIIFGVFNVVVLYIFSRLFFKRTLAFLIAVVMAFSYPHVAISRLAYEATASFFFQILALTFLYLACTTNRSKYFIASGICLGLGMYTYIGFRTFFIVFILTVLALLIINKKKISDIAKSLFLLLAAFLISAAPLISYSLLHQDSILARAKSLSVFGQGLPRQEILKELQGASLRLSNLFVLDGDPNPRFNPSGASTFDIVTTGFFFLGLVVLFKRSKKIFFVCLAFLLPSIVNDIFSLERIPEFHYYGLGHPNTLRIAGIIPLVYFIFGYGISGVKDYLNKGGRQFYLIFLSFSIGFILLTNWHLYFNQMSVNPGFFLYNYKYNQARILTIAGFMNQSLAKEVVMSPSLYNTQGMNYFLKKDVKVITLSGSKNEIISTINSGKMVILDASIDKNLTQNIIEYSQNISGLFRADSIVNPAGGIEALVFLK